MQYPYFWLGSDAEENGYFLESYEREFFEDGIAFIPEIDLTDPQSDE